MHEQHFAVGKQIKSRKSLLNLLDERVARDGKRQPPSTARQTLLVCSADSTSAGFRPEAVDGGSSDATTSSDVKRNYIGVISAVHIRRVQVVSCRVQVQLLYW
jgi:hypothetical protein